MTSTKRRLAGLASASAMIAVVAVASLPMAALAAKPTGTPSAPAASYSNGFEKASDVLSGAVGTTPGTAWVSNVTRINATNAPDAFKSAAGKFYGTAAEDAYVFTRLGGYSATFPTKGFTTSVDIYLDMSQNKVAGTDLRFDWDAAISNAAGGYARDFIFNAGTNPAVAGQFLVSASNNSGMVPADGLAPLTISTSGWYTFKHNFKNVDGQLTVDMSVIDAGGAVLKTWILSPSGDIVGHTIGGNRYAWLATNDFGTLALDNVTRVTN